MWGADSPVLHNGTVDPRAAGSHGVAYPDIWVTRSIPARAGSPLDTMVTIRRISQRLPSCLLCVSCEQQLCRLTLLGQWVECPRHAGLVQLAYSGLARPLLYCCLAVPQTIRPAQPRCGLELLLTVENSYTSPEPISSIADARNPLKRSGTLRVTTTVIDIQQLPNLVNHAWNEFVLLKPPGSFVADVPL